MALLICLAGIYFLLAKPKPPDLSGLVPLTIPIDFDRPNVATFKASYTEPHYIGFSMIKKIRSSRLMEKQASNFFGYKGEQPQYDLAWKVFEGNTLLASGPGKPSGLTGSTIMLGSFQLVAGKTYRLEVITGLGLISLKPTNPVLEVGVDHAAVSVGLALRKDIDKFIFKLAAYIFFSGSILLLLITFAAHKIQNAQLFAPTDVRLRSPLLMLSVRQKQQQYWNDHLQAKGD